MLVLDGVHTYYGHSHVLQGVNLEVKKGSAIALLGRNGVGKTTTLRSVLHLTPARSGRITLDGQDITRRSTTEIVRSGVGYIPAGRRVFGDLTVYQNLYLGMQRSNGQQYFTLDRILEIFPKLQTILDRPARFLSGGEQQMLKFGRCLLANPSVLLLDEPSEGLAPTIVRELMGIFVPLRERGISFIICEQNVRFALALADEAYVLEKGRVIFRGTAKEIDANTELHAHLGFD